MAREICAAQIYCENRVASKCEIMIFIPICLVALSTVLAQGGNLVIAADELEQQRVNDASQQQATLGQAPGADWLFGQPRASSTGARLNSSEPLDSKLMELLERIGPDMKPASGFLDFRDISTELSKRAWQLMRERASEMADTKVSSLWPSIEQSLLESNVTSDCLEAARKVSERARALDAWATKCEFAELGQSCRNFALGKKLISNTKPN